MIAAPFAQAQDLDIIRDHFKSEIFESIPLEGRATWALKDINEFQAYQSPDGSYSDLNYLDSSALNWGPVITLGRALSMIMATQVPGHVLFHHQKTEDAALNAIRFVARSNFWHYNWWMMEIGVPLTTYKILLLIEPKLDALSRDYLMDATYKGHITEHPSQWSVAGQNLVWYAEITIALGVLYKRPDWVNTAVAALSNQILMGHNQGIQADYTFFQHGQLFYSGSYGLAFSNDTSRMFRLISGTKLSFSDENYQTLSHYILDGQLWLIHGATIDVSSMGRTYARINDAKSDRLLPACHLMAKVVGTRQKEFVECERRLTEGTENGRDGNQHFWKSDFMAHNRPGYGISVRMDSTRTMNADASPMGEGLKSEHLADGLTYIYRTGKEYFNIYPLWDFKRLPGTTTEYQAVYPSVPNSDYFPKNGETEFVGGVSDGNTGAAAMDFRKGRLSAKKSWFFFEKGMVALGAAIHCEGCLPVNTTLNQEWAQTPIQYSFKNQSNRVASLSEGKASANNLAWALANGTGYLFLDHNNVTLQTTEQVGSWKSLAVQLSADPVKGKVTSLWIDHCSNPLHDSYAYAVLPNISEKDLQKDALQPPFSILANTEEIQAVEFNKEKSIQVIFYKAGTLTFNEGKSWIKVDAPLALQFRFSIEKNSLSVSAPNQKVSTAKISWHIEHYGAGSKTILFPKSQYAGQSQTLVLQGLMNRLGQFLHL